MLAIAAFAAGSAYADLYRLRRPRRRSRRGSRARPTEIYGASKTAAEVLNSTGAARWPAASPLPKMSAYDILLEINAKIPRKDKITLDIDKLEIDDQKVDIERHREDREEIDLLVAELKKIECFKDVAARPDGDGRGRRQEIQAHHPARVHVRTVMSAFTDKARDFWDRISPRERRLVVIAAHRRADHARDLARPLDPRRPRRRWSSATSKTRKALDVLADLRARGETGVPRATTSSRRWAPSRSASTTYLDNAAKKAASRSSRRRRTRRSRATAL